jgi:hypothetical protein
MPKPKSFSECEIKDGKVYHDGCVGVLVSYGFGAGWSTWNKDHSASMFDPTVISIVMDVNDDLIGHKEEQIKVHCKKKYNHFYTGGSNGLVVEWIPAGTQFKINEYDGAESTEFKENEDWITA